MPSLTPLAETTKTLTGLAELVATPALYPSSSTFPGSSTFPSVGSGLSVSGVTEGSKTLTPLSEI